MKSKQNLRVKGRSAISLLNPKRFEKLIFYLLIFFLPTQVAFHFWPDWALRFGVRVDYLSPALYLTDFLVISLLLISKVKAKLRLILPVGLFALLNIIFSISPWSSLFKWLKIFEFYLFGVWVSGHKEYFKGKLFIRVLSGSLIFISIIGITQFILGRTVGGLLYLLGERSFNFQTPGIALENILGKIFLRPYSVFSHPNSLAGFLGLVLIYFTKISSFSKIFSGITFLISGSFGAFISIISSQVFKKIGRAFFIFAVLVSLAMPFINLKYSGGNIGERFYLAKVAGEIIKNNFLTGSGLNTFVSQNALLQPVHNIFLLAFSELGIFGVLFLVWILFKAVQKNPAVLIFILATGITDHYWLTLQQNMLLLAIVFGMVL